MPKIKYQLSDTMNDTRQDCDSWEDAAEAAVQMGVGRWDNAHEFKLDWPFVIKAVRVPE